MKKSILTEEERKAIEDDVRALGEQVMFWSEVIDRPLKQSEYIYVKYIKEQNIPLSKQVRAYGITVKNCEKFSFPYMAKIISNWIEEGRAK